MRSVGRASIFICTSSSSTAQGKVPSSTARAIVETNEDCVPLLNAKHPLLGEHGGMGLGAGEVVACEALVKAYGRGETLHEGIGGFREAATLLRRLRSWLFLTTRAQRASIARGGALAAAKGRGALLEDRPHRFLPILAPQSAANVGQLIPKMAVHFRARVARTTKRLV